LFFLGEINLSNCYLADIKRYKKYCLRKCVCYWDGSVALIEK